MSNPIQHGERYSERNVTAPHVIPEMNTEASYHLKLYTDKLPVFFFRRCKEVSLKGRKDMWLLTFLETLPIPIPS